MAPKIWEPKIRKEKKSKIIVAITKFTLSEAERSLPPRLLWYLKMSTTPEKIVLHNAREKTAGKEVGIYLVYRAPADKLTNRKITKIIFKLPSGWCFI